jgi:hypothetical protein
MQALEHELDGRGGNLLGKAAQGSPCRGRPVDLERLS